MPELPEVETIRKQLERYLLGKKIIKVSVSLPKMVKLSLFQFKKVVQGSVVEAVKRRAKILIIVLDNGWSLLIHLKLSGRLIYRESEEKISFEDKKWNHLIYYFADGSLLLHNDLRQFGYVKAIPTERLEQFFNGQRLGPEPLGESFTLSRFLEILTQRPKGKINSGCWGCQRKI